MGMYAMTEEQFYGDPEKRITGACKQLIDGNNAFGFLYNVDEGENSRTDVKIILLWGFFLVQLCCCSTLHRRDDWLKIAETIDWTKPVEGWPKCSSLDQESHGNRP